MNSTILILDTRFGIEDDLCKEAPMHKWWESHKHVYYFPRDWYGKLSELGEFLIEHHQKGILVITENLDIKRHIKRIFRDIPSTCGGVIAEIGALRNTTDKHRRRRNIVVGHTRQIS